ncbi:MAG: histidinol-phosphate transaminase, partial [Paludibacteraceae bacterium]
MMNINNLLRKNILSLQPYSCARDEFQGEASVYLDANESPYNAPFNRYPDPLQQELKKKIGKLKSVPTENIFLGNGSDEAIDLIYRAFCEPRINNAVAIDPTYGMYKVCASINDVEYRKVLLDTNFQFTADSLLRVKDTHTKVMWLCSPNNPTGNDLDSREIEKLLNQFSGIVVLDEAYIDFSARKSFTDKLSEYPNLIILQTLSKAWGSASIRLGMAFASTEIISVFNKIKYPYNVNLLTQQQAIKILDNEEQTNKWVAKILSERKKLIQALSNLNITRRIYPTDANFVLIRVDDANAIYQQLVDKGIIVRNRNNVSLCEGCLRITVGTQEENDTLLDELKKL